MCDGGTAGLICATASGSIDEILAEEPTVLSFDVYKSNPEALEALVRDRLYFRDLNSRERKSLGVIAHAKGNGHLQLYQCENNGNDSDPKLFRSTVSFAGPVVKMSPPGFVPGLSGKGARVYDEMQRHLVEVANSQSAAASCRAYDLTWKGLRVGNGGANAIIGAHTDQSSQDVDSEGRVDKRNARAVYHNGGDFYLRIAMTVVWMEEVEEEDGSSTLAERTRRIASCEIKIPSPGVYVLDHRLSGRQRVGTMMFGGKLRSVVLYHSTRPVEDQQPINRSITNIDTIFDTENKEENFIGSFMRGEVDLLPDFDWYKISRSLYSSAAALRNHQDRMITMVVPYSTDDGCSCRCCGGRVDYLDVRGEGVSEALERIRRIVHGGDEEDVDDNNDDDNESDGETGDEAEIVRLLDGTPAPTNKNGVSIALGVRVIAYWKRNTVTVPGRGADYSGTITLVTENEEGKGVCEVTHQHGGERFVFQYEFDELYLSEDAEAKNVIYDPSKPTSLLPLLFTCKECVSPLKLRDGDLVSKPCRRCMVTPKLEGLAFCGPCGKYTCSGMVDPDSRERKFFCTGKEGQATGIELDSSNIYPGSKWAICGNCERARHTRACAKKRRNDGARTNDFSMGSEESHREFWTVMEDEATRTAGGFIRWRKVAEILGREDKMKVKSAYKRTWSGKERKKCGKCKRCKKGTQCVVDLESFEDFIDACPGVKFGRDAQGSSSSSYSDSGNGKKHKKSN